MSRPLPSRRYRTRHSNNRISEAVVAIGALTLGSALFMSKLMDRSEIVRDVHWSTPPGWAKLFGRVNWGVEGVRPACKSAALVCS
jgi:hypothetical protein